MPVKIDSLPNVKKGKISYKPLPLYQYARTAADEVKGRRLSKARCVQMLECMTMIRSFEEMIYTLRLGGYKPLSGFQYRGPTHLSIGQEAVSAGACAAIGLGDYITSTHRGHGDGIAKGFWAILEKSDEQLRKDLGQAADGLKSREELEEAAKELHMMRTAAELFGREDGYCKGRGGGMHIADFSVNHLGANAIVGAGVPIATGAGMGLRYRRSGEVVLSFAGDGAYNNGVVLESLNMAAMAQFTNELAEKPFDRQEFPFQFLEAFGNKDTTLKRLRTGVSNKSDLERDALSLNRQRIHKRAFC